MTIDISKTEKNIENFLDTIKALDINNVSLKIDIEKKLEKIGADIQLSVVNSSKILNHPIKELIKKDAEDSKTEENLKKLRAVSEDAKKEYTAKGFAKIINKIKYVFQNTTALDTIKNISNDFFQDIVSAENNIELLRSDQKEVFEKEKVINFYIESIETLIKKLSVLDVAENEKKEFIEELIKTLSQRNYSLKNTKETIKEFVKSLDVIVKFYKEVKIISENGLYTEIPRIGTAIMKCYGINNMQLMIEKKQLLTKSADKISENALKSMENALKLIESEIKTPQDALIKIQESYKSIEAIDKNFNEMKKETLKSFNENFHSYEKGIDTIRIDVFKMGDKTAINEKEEFLKL